MELDYYQLLGVPRNATAEELKQAYKLQAVRWHPDKNSSNQDAASEKFKQVAEAFHVLNDPQKRAVYDAFGLEGLKGRVPAASTAGASGRGSSSTSRDGTRFTHSVVGPDEARRLFESLFGGLGGPGSSSSSSNNNNNSSNSTDTFHRFFGGGHEAWRRPGSSGGSGGSDDDMFEAEDPFGLGIFDGSGGGHSVESFFQQQRQQQSGGFGPQSFFQQQRRQPGTAGSSSTGGLPDSFFQRRQGQQQQQQQVQEVPLVVGLEELYTGATKRLQVTRHLLDAGSGQSLPVQEELQIQVQPGWKDGTRVTFPGKGDELAPGGPAADLAFVIRQAPHPTFQRRGNDLHTVTRIPLVTALAGGEVRVALLDGRAVVLVLDQPVSAGGARVVAGEGMPVSRQPGRRGDLVVEFQVEFPASLTAFQKQELRRILPAA